MVSETRLKLKTTQISAFALPATGLAIFLFFVQFFFLKYGTEVLLLPPAIVGIMLALAKIWDAVSDPIIGSLSDRTNGRLGRRHPWMWWAIPVMGLGFLAIWGIPASFGLWLKVSLAMLALLVFYTGFTMHSVPHVSFGAELSSDSHQRVRAFGARHVFWTVGLFVSFAFIQMTSGKSQSAVFMVALGIVVIAAVLCSVTPLFMRPRPVPQMRVQSSLAKDYKSVLSERGAAILFLVWFIENLGAGVLGGLAPFYADYVIERPDLVGALPAIYAFAGIASIPPWVLVSRILGKKTTWIIAMLLGALGFALTYASSVSLMLLFIGLGLAGAGMGCGGVMAIAVMADLVDRLEARTGERREGAFTALLNFGLKTGIALSTAFGGLMLGFVGFQANQIQSPETIDAIRLFFALFPSVGFLIGALLFARFPAVGPVSEIAAQPLTT